MMRQLRERSISAKWQVNADSSTSRAIAARIGSGKLRRPQIRDLRAHERARAGNAADKEADLGSQHFGAGRIAGLVDMANPRFSN